MNKHYIRPDEHDEPENEELGIEPKPLLGLALVVCSTIIAVALIAASVG